MKRTASAEDISKFRADREMLIYLDCDIAPKMGISKGNFSSYMSGRVPITNSFLRRFNATFGNELDKIKQTKIKIQSIPSLEEGLIELSHSNKLLRQANAELRATCKLLQGQNDLWAKRLGTAKQ